MRICEYINKKLIKLIIKRVYACEYTSLNNLIAKNKVYIYQHKCMCIRCDVCLNWY